MRELYRTIAIAAYIYYLVASSSSLTELGAINTHSSIQIGFLLIANRSLALSLSRARSARGSSMSTDCLWGKMGEDIVLGRNVKQVEPTTALYMHIKESTCKFVAKVFNFAHWYTSTSFDFFSLSLTHTHTWANTLISIQASCACVCLFVVLSYGEQKKLYARVIIL